MKVRATDIESNQSGHVMTLIDIRVDAHPRNRIS